MTILTVQLGIPDDASPAVIAEHAYNYLHTQSPTAFPCSWERLPEALRLALTLAAIAGAEQAQSLIYRDTHRKLDQLTAGANGRLQ